MARQQRIDQNLKSRLDEYESALFRLKVAYEKYFGGLEKLEPGKDLEDTRRLARELTKVNWGGAALTFRYQALKARCTSIDLYITRNLVMIERGTHPKFKFRADQAERARPPSEAPSRDLKAVQNTEAQMLRKVFDSYVEARKACGQHGKLDFENFKTVLRAQAEAIRKKQGCKTVRFRVDVQDGQARLKALPVVDNTEKPLS